MLEIILILSIVGGSMFLVLAAACLFADHVIEPILDKWSK